jgi:hypothetical protein
MFAIHIALGIVVEDEHQAGEAGEGGRAQVGEVGNSGHLNFDRHRDLALNLLGAAPRPLGDDLHVVVGDVGVGLNGKGAERNNAPNGEDEQLRPGRASGFSAQSRRVHGSKAGPQACKARIKIR